ncbi:phospholipase D-like domain-containing protein [Pantoea agglomerans]|nr:phospholipase D-like domain-containing protein [Pantoea agglomerans]
MKRKAMTAGRWLTDWPVPVFRKEQMHNTALCITNFFVTGNNGVQTGSFNYTSSAEKRNAENALVIRNNPNLTQQYQNEFNRLWAESSPVQCNYS